jgi:hypothetical protein
MDSIIDLTQDDSEPESAGSIKGESSDDEEEESVEEDNVAGGDEESSLDEQADQESPFRFSFLEPTDEEESAPESEGEDASDWSPQDSDKEFTEAIEVVVEKHMKEDLMPLFHEIAADLPAAAANAIRWNLRNSRVQLDATEEEGDHCDRKALME